EWEELKGSSIEITDAELKRVGDFFAPASYATLPASDTYVSALKLGKDRAFGSWVSNNVTPHKVPGYSIVTISVKAPGLPPGDISDVQMEAVADLADRFSQGRVVITHMQNLVLPDVPSQSLEALWRELSEI